MLRPGDTFMFAGRLLRFIRVRENVGRVADGGDGEPMVPAYAGGRMPLTTNLADRVRGMLQDPDRWHAFPEQVREWLALQKPRLPAARPRRPAGRDLPARRPLVSWWPTASRAATPTRPSGMLLTRRMERVRLRAAGLRRHRLRAGLLVAREPHDIARLFEQDMLGDDVEAWMAESSMLRRTFRNVSVIAGLIERNQPGAEKNRRQVTVNSDLIYDVLRRHQPDHILLRATRADAAAGLTDLGRIAGMLERVQGRIAHMALSRVSPLAVPVLLDIGREVVRYEGSDDALLEDAETLVAEATGEAEPPPFKPIHVPAILRPNLKRGRTSRGGGMLFQ